MENTPTQVYHWALRVITIEKARGLLETSHEAFGKSYKRLTDEQKIAFILAGGRPPSFHDRQTRTDSQSDTGQLPILC